MDLGERARTQTLGRSSATLNWFHRILPPTSRRSNLGAGPFW